MIEVTVDSVRSSYTTQDRLVMLRERDADRYLPIRIGPHEAFFIAIELQKVAPPRPLTPDLLKNVVQELGARVTQVVVTDLVDETYYARLILDMQGRHVEVDARPSDAIAIAIRTHAPIYVEEAVMAKAAITLEPDRGEEKPARQREREGKPVDPAKLGVFRDFISSLENLDELGRPER